MASRPPAESAESQGGHEESRFNIRAYAWFIVLFVLIAAVIHVVLWITYGVLAGTVPVRPVSPVADQTPAPPPPRQQASAIHPALPREDLAAMRQQEQSLLSSYGWVDSKSGLARIPIGRAMELALERGLVAGPPASRPAATEAAGMTVAGRPSTTAATGRAD